MMQPQLSSLMIYPRKKETKTTPPKTVPSHLTKKKRKKKKRRLAQNIVKQATNVPAGLFVCFSIES